MILLKWGGSLITKKDQAQTPRTQTIRRLAGEIAQAFERRPGMRLVLGHGSGSYGHHVAAIYETHRGASSEDDWRGFAEVWKVANRLNRLVIDNLVNAGLPAMAFPPSASARCRRGEILDMAVEPIQQALEKGLLPVVHGDVAFDLERGSSILSTEVIFCHLAQTLKPERVLLAGMDRGVYVDPHAEEILSVITDLDLPHLNLGGASATDVTGGMRAKVEAALALAQSSPQVEVRIFSVEEPGSLLSALLGGQPGTRIVVT